MQTLLGIAVYIKDKSSLTTKLFEILLDKHMSIEVNAELLSYFKEFKDLDEYQSVVGSVEDPVSRTISLKKLVFRLYRDHRLKDLDFLKYLVWSGQGHLCKLIGYGDKQIEKMMKDKDYQKLSLRLIRDDDDTGNDTGNHHTTYNTKSINVNYVQYFAFAHIIEISIIVHSYVYVLKYFLYPKHPSPCCYLPQLLKERIFYLILHGDLEELLHPAFSCLKSAIRICEPRINFLQNSFIDVSKTAKTVMLFFIETFMV